MSIDGEIRILLVEDEADSMAVLQETLLSLHGLNFHFLTATQGRQGLQILHEQAVDLVIADILMPEMSGLEMLAHMKAQGFWLPCIFATSLQRRDVGVEAMRLGAFDFIEKPLSKSRIEEPIHKAIHVSRAFQKFWQMQQVSQQGSAHAAALEITKLRAMRFQNHAGEW
jgi:DNA-binding NtrC family response regulator